MSQLSNNESAWIDTIRKDFTKEEWAERDRHVATIKNWKDSTTAAAKALVEIKEKNLDRHYKSWKVFCERECGITSQWANELIKYAKILTGLTEVTKLVSLPVKPVLALSEHPQEQHDEIVKEAIRVHSKDGKSLTVKGIREAATQINKAVDLEGTPIPEGDATKYWKRKIEGDEIVAKIEAIKKAIEHLNTFDSMWVACDLQSVLGSIKAAIHTFKGGLPAYVCPKCHGLRPTNCATCHGRGTIGTWDMKKKVGGKPFHDELVSRMGKEPVREPYEDEIPC